MASFHLLSPSRRARTTNTSSWITFSSSSSREGGEVGSMNSASFTWDIRLWSSSSQDLYSGGGREK